MYTLQEFYHLALIPVFSSSNNIDFSTRFEWIELILSLIEMLVCWSADEYWNFSWIYSCVHFKIKVYCVYLESWHIQVLCYYCTYYNWNSIVTNDTRKIKYEQEEVLVIINMFVLTSKSKQNIYFKLKELYFNDFNR